MISDRFVVALLENIEKSVYFHALLLGPSDLRFGLLCLRGAFLLEGFWFFGLGFRTGWSLVTLYLYCFYDL